MALIDFDKIAKAVEGAVKDASDWTEQAAKDAADWTGQAVKDAADWTGQAATDAADWTGQAVKDAAEWTGQAATDAAEWTGQAATDAVDWTGQAVKDAAEWTGQAATDAVDWTGQAVKDAAEWTEQAAKDVAEWTEQAIKDASNAAASFASGVIVKLLKDVDINSIMMSVKAYGMKLGVDVSPAVNFIDNLASIKNGINEASNTTSDETIAKVTSIVDNAPLAEILDTIEAVISYLPLPYIDKIGRVVCKILRVMLKLQPAASTAMHLIADTQETPCVVNSKYDSFIPTDNTPELVSLRSMVDIALEDGELTDDEEAFLLKKAESAGIDKDLLLMGLRNEIKKMSK